MTSEYVEWKVYIDKALAEEMLVRNTRNRALREQQVEKYANEMRKHHFQCNGNVFYFDDNWVLVDGQHRLSAIAKSETRMYCTVRSGVNDILTFDNGITRNSRDQLALQLNAKVAPQACAACKILLCYSNGKTSAARSYLNNNMVVGCYQFLKDDIEKIVGASSRCNIKAAVLAAYLFSMRYNNVPYSDIVTFDEAYRSGYSDMPRDSCAITLKKWWERIKTECTGWRRDDRMFLATVTMLNKYKRNAVCKRIPLKTLVIDVFDMSDIRYFVESN